MQNDPLISIIIPVYNAQEYILHTINSVLEQSYQTFEIIVVDNCSTDNSRTLIKNIQDNRISLIELDYNSGGPARPRNIGLENAKGDYVAFLDADDIWERNKLETQLSFLMKNDVEFTSCGYTLIDKKNKEIKLGSLSSFYIDYINKTTICDLIKNNFILTSAVLVKRSLLKKFNESEKYVAAEDFDMWLQILADYGNSIYKYQKEKLIRYRILQTSTSNRKDPLKQELKANLVLANFVLEHDKFVSCYLYRLFFHIIIKKFKNIIKKMNVFK